MFKVYNARAQLLFCSSIFSFSNVTVSVAVVVLSTPYYKIECMDCPPVPKEVAVVETWPWLLVEVRLYLLTSMLIDSVRFPFQCNHTISVAMPTNHLQQQSPH